MSFDTATPRIASYVIFKKDKKIAFVLRKDCGWMNGYYGLPSGKVEKTESYMQAAMREAKEEVGVDVKESELKFVHSMHRLEGDDWVDAYFEAKSWDDDLSNAEPHKHESLEWLDINNLPKNVIPSVKQALEYIEKGIKFSEYGWSK